MSLCPGQCVPASSRWGHGVVAVPFHGNCEKTMAPGGPFLGRKLVARSLIPGRPRRQKRASVCLQPPANPNCMATGPGGGTGRGLVTPVARLKGPSGTTGLKSNQKRNGSEPSFGSCLSPRNKLLALEAKRPAAQASVCTGGRCVCKPSHQPPGPATGQCHSQAHSAAAHTHAAHTHTRLPTVPPTRLQTFKVSTPGRVHIPLLIGP